MRKGDMGQHIVEHNKQLLQNNQNAFQQTFGKSLHSLMHPLFGFDVIAFDKWLGTPDGTSTRDYLLEQYDEDALELITGLLG